ncbi:MAG: aminotransferase class III-fold pyridoxal phosphate-dependent enzyme, partial [Erysipelotrichaceae bacterium]|nr:aminotransferase class III-fold pyridoxal phosphate-dependent enzyme [Erysipelotrichaceae bacterium]
MKNFKELDQQYVAHTYARWPICVQSGQGCVLKDVEGKEYLDFTSGIGVSSLGYSHPAWVRAVSDQLQSLAHVSNLFYTQPMLKLAQSLCQRTGMKKVFFANSGAEANEGAIKTARKYANQKYQGKRDRILTLVNSFHGRTLATLSATGQESFHTQFEPFPA